MATLVQHEIDGTDTFIQAKLADDYFIMLDPNAKDRCLAKDIHLFKGEDGTYYLADKDCVVLAVGMTTIRTYINYLL
ncbi:MAG: hypothetical protein IJ137_00425 [Eubacterium sp.]|nr:hypothetical protein [Eubacterium sp.]